jgi:hypothetical protein
MKTPVYFLEEMMTIALGEHHMSLFINEFNKAKKMENKNKLEKQLFIGKVSEIIGFEKTVELLKEAKQEIEQL